jgi:hypothetical protein
MAADARNSKVRIKLFGCFGKQFRCLKRLGRAGEERRGILVCLWRKQWLAIEGGKFSRFLEPRWRRTWGRWRPRAQVKVTILSRIRFESAARCSKEIFWREFWRSTCGSHYTELLSRLDYYFWE